MINNPFLIIRFPQTLILDDTLEINGILLYFCACETTYKQSIASFLALNIKFRMIKTILLLLLAFWQTNQLFPHIATTKRFNYTFQQLALTWPGHFCGGDKWCDRRWISQWNGRNFIVHGLWPASRQFGFIDMISNNDADPFCNASQSFSPYDLPLNLSSRLQSIMPQLTKSDIWSHEWYKHGVCYLRLLNNRLYGSGSDINRGFGKRIMVKYFESICSLYDRIAGRFNLTKGEYGSGDELARDLKLDPTTVKFVVDGGNLKEILVCVSLPNSEAASEVVQRCEQKTTYRGSIRLPGWRAQSADAYSTSKHHGGDLA